MPGRSTPTHPPRVHHPTPTRVPTTPYHPGYPPPPVPTYPPPYTHCSRLHPARTSVSPGVNNACLERTDLGRFMYQCFGSGASQFCQSGQFKDRFRLRLTATGRRPSGRPSFERQHWLTALLRSLVQRPCWDASMPLVSSL